ncbi:ATP-binding protein/SpoIIE family protein phosphatase [Trichocoleus desertorum AS-A10]|uniref:ATP-binding SpoIIE family protein phosphatase n=1 Tax=Trichocoleus desertorum TaxID=1481672 RepID=UPI00329A07C2
MTHPIVLSMVEPSQVGEARRRAASLATQLGFSEVEQGKVGIVVTEIANNLIKHAQEGALLLRSLERQGVAGLEILSLDRGPGMRDVSECLRDGFSTGGTSGTGLGAIQRLSDQFEVYSASPEGTAIFCRLWAGSACPVYAAGELEIGVVCLPMQGEEVSGDAYCSQFVGDRHLLLIADGLGHGPMAAQASLEAVKVFQEAGDRTPSELMADMHAALRSTRGAAVAIAEVNLQEQRVQYVGVGNIVGSLLATDQPIERSTNMVSHNGTVGCEMRKNQTFTYSWKPKGILIMHSDGLGTKWRLDRYPGLVNQHPSLIAGILYRDFNRGRDDVTVLVAREVN